MVWYKFCLLNTIQLDWKYLSQVLLLNAVMEYNWDGWIPCIIMQWY